MILFAKVLIGLFALLSAIVTFLLQNKDDDWQLWGINRRIWRRLGFTCFVLASVGYIYGDYRDEALRQASDAEFRSVMIDVSRDILRTAHPYHPKEIRFEYCFDQKMLMAVAQEKWGDVSDIEAWNQVADMGSTAFKILYGSRVAIYFTTMESFRDGLYLKLDMDRASLQFQPHQITNVVHNPYEPSSQPTNGEAGSAFCQHVYFSVPEAGFNSFDRFNAIKAQSYYDLSETQLFLYLVPSIAAQRNGISAPRAKNLSVVFGNGVKRFYLQEDDDVRSQRFMGGHAYRQASDIPRIEEDYPSLVDRFSTP